MLIFVKVTSQSSNKKSLQLALLILFLVSLPFSYWFKQKQLSLISKNLPSLYPVAYWLEGLFTVSLVLSLLWLLFQVVVTLLVEIRKVHVWRIASAASILLLSLTWAGLSVFCCCVLIFLTQLALFAYFYRGKGLQWASPNVRTHLLALAIILLSQWGFNGFTSPSSWDNPLAAIRKVESNYLGLASSIHQTHYVDAKKHSFSGFDYSAWASYPHNGTAGESFLVPVLTLALDLPSVDTETFQRLILVLCFIWCVLSCFCFYLFLSLALEMSLLTSLLGALLLLFSNWYFTLEYTEHFPIFCSVFLTLPIALLFTRLGFKKRRADLAWLGGIAFSSSFYFIQAHPDNVIHGTFFWCSYLLFLVLFDFANGNLRERAKLAVLAGTGFGLGALYSVGPVLEPVLRNEAHVFGHTSGIIFYYGLELAWQNGIWPWLRIFFPFLFLALVRFKVIASHKNRRVDFLFFTLAALTILILLVPANDGLVASLLTKFKIQGINFRNSSRIFTYLSFSMLMVSLYGIDSFLRQNAHAKMVRGVCLFLLLFSLAMIVRKFSIYHGLYLTILSLIASVAYFVKRDAKKNYPAVPLLPHFSVSLAVILIAADTSSIQWRGLKEVGNPDNCKPYITVSTLLTRHNALSNDETATVRLLKKRISQFETDFNKTSPAPFPDSYAKVLSHFQVQSSRELQNASVLAFAKEAMNAIDNFYVEKFRCIFPDDALKFHSDYKNGEPAPLYNLTALFLNLPDRLHRVVWGTDYQFSMAIAGGYLFSQTTQCPDLKLMSTYPSINALYARPGSYFTDVGKYGFDAHFVFGSEILTNPLIRKIFNIGGVDYLVLRKNILNQPKYLKDTELLPVNLPAALTPPFVVLKDSRSYGMAYLARSITYIPRSMNRFDRFRFPLVGPLTKNDPAILLSYEKEVDQAHQALLKLEKKHDILLETTDDDFTNKKTILPLNNFMEIENILAERASFRVQCLHPPCRLVFNNASLTGWNAFSDSVRLPIERANFAFLSVDVPKGSHTVWFEHRFLSGTLGALVTLLAYCIGLTLFLIRLETDSL